MACRGSRGQGHNAQMIRAGATFLFSFVILSTRVLSTNVRKTIEGEMKIEKEAIGRRPQDRQFSVCASRRLRTMSRQTSSSSPAEKKNMWSWPSTNASVRGKGDCTVTEMPGMVATCMFFNVNF